MVATSPRRGEVRPISGLPDSEDAEWVEVQDADGTARRMDASSLGGGDPFPDNPATYGAATGDDEEWDGAETLAERGWTVETAFSGLNTYDINGVFTPSRLVGNINSNTNDAMGIYRALADVNPAANISVTFDASGAFATDFKSIECGLRTSAAASSAAMTGVIGHTTLNPGGGNINGLYVTRRKYTNIGTSTFTEQAFALQATFGPIGSVNMPFRFFFHLQRVSDSWSLWHSSDGVNWNRIQSTTTDSFTTAFLYLRMGGFGATAPYKLVNNWIRFNRFFL